jgi:hypothetical protein
MPPRDSPSTFWGLLTVCLVLFRATRSLNASPEASRRASSAASAAVVAELEGAATRLGLGAAWLVVLAGLQQLLLCRLSCDGRLRHRGEVGARAGAQRVVSAMMGVVWWVVVGRGWVCRRVGRPMVARMCAAADRQFQRVIFKP